MDMNHLIFTLLSAMFFGAILIYILYSYRRLDSECRAIEVNRLVIFLLLPAAMLTGCNNDFAPKPLNVETTKLSETATLKRLEAQDAFTIAGIAQ